MKRRCRHRVLEPETVSRVTCWYTPGQGWNEEK